MNLLGISTSRTQKHSLHGLMRAFTLLELIVVVVVIAILVAVLLPSLAGTAAAARRTKCGVNLRSLALAVGVYRVGNHGTIPVAENPFNEATGLRREVVEQPFEAMHSELEYAGDWARFTPAGCPADDRVHPRIGISYYYMPAIIFGYLADFTPAQREHRVREVQRLYRTGVLYTDLWTEIDRSAHAGRRRVSDTAFQVAGGDGSVRFIQERGMGGFDPSLWFR